MSSSEIYGGGCRSGLFLFLLYLQLYNSVILKKVWKGQVFMWVLWDDWAPTLQHRNLVGFYCKVFITEIAISKAIRQESHCIRTQKSLFGKEEVQDRACTSTCLMETLEPVTAWLELLAELISCPFPASNPSEWLFNQPGWICHRLWAGALRFQVVTAAPGNSTPKQSQGQQGTRWSPCLPMQWAPSPA